MDNIIIEADEAAFYGGINGLGAGYLRGLGGFVCFIELAGNKPDEDLSQFSGSSPAAEGGVG